MRHFDHGPCVRAGIIGERAQHPARVQVDHEYAIGEGRETIAEVSKKWFRIRDTYGVAIAPGQNDVLILAITVAIDMMAHRRR